MTDRELLEAAARAAWIEGKFMNFWGEVGIVSESPDGGMWNPLESDGDALRLAVTVGILDGYSHLAAAELVSDIRSLRDEGIDPYAATRRAIVRAAAAMAKEPK